MRNSEPDAAPRAFISYAWETEEHQAWVLRLASRLRSNGVDVILDVWNTRLGTDLASFMESGITSADRVLVISSDQYVSKANQPQGGVGYEKKMLTPKLMTNLSSDLVVPIIKNRTSAPLLPTFLGAAKYVDFRDGSQHEEKYAELLHDIHGRQIHAVPPLGPNPFQMVPAAEVPDLFRNDAARYVSPSISGRASFDYSNNSGNYVIGSGEMAFTVHLSEAGHGSIHLYRDPGDIHSIALAPNVADFEAVADASRFDTSSRSRTIKVGDAAILRNQAGFYAVLLLDSVLTRESAPDGKHLIEFRYHIQSQKSSHFS